jgi:hypothetical protein
MAFDTRCVEFVEVVDAELHVRLACFQDVINHNQQTVRDGDCGLVASTASSNTIELRIKVRGALFNGRPGNLAHNPSKPNVAPIRRPFHPLPPVTECDYGGARREHNFPPRARLEWDGNTQNHWTRSQTASIAGSEHQTETPCAAATWPAYRRVSSPLPSARTSTLPLLLRGQVWAGPLPTIPNVRSPWRRISTAAPTDPM